MAMLFLGASAHAQTHPDSCQALLPRSLSDSLARAFPGYRTPLETDNAPDDIQRSLDHGGTACLGVGIADFTGDGKKDYLVGLTAEKGSAGLAVIALPVKGGWRFRRIRSGAEAARFRQYVTAVEPGRYERSKGLGLALEPGERQSIDCLNWGAKAGAVEAAGFVTCYEDGRWLYVRAFNCRAVGVGRWT
jgi:hypothetical protein